MGRRLAAVPAIWAGFVTVLVASPWLAGGYIFGTDWPGPRRFDFPSDLSSSAPVEVVLAGISRIISGEWTGKLFVLGLLFLAALMAFRAAPIDGLVPRAVASTIFVFNPFVFGRLHYGQIFLLAGYALLPWVSIRLRKLLTQPTAMAGVLLALSLVAVGIFTVHLVLVAGLLVTSIALSHAISARERIDYLKRVAPSVLMAVGLTVVLSSYWLVPLVMGHGYEATVIGGTTTGDLAAYAAVSDPQLGLVPNLLGLYGFWAEDTGRFTSMKDFVPFWPLILGLLLAVGAVGAVTGLRSKRDQLAPWIAGLLVAAAIALVLEMGVSHPWTSGLVTWLDSHVPLYRGMRDAGKWATLLALVYSQLAALGAAAILEWLKKRVRGGQPSTEWIVSVATGLLIALPLYYGNGLLFGMHGEINPSQYPAGWYAADRLIAAGGSDSRALFLPWHEYMSYSFVKNENQVIASPAPTFFSFRVLVSSNPEVPGVAAPTDPDQVAVANLVQAGSQGRWAAELKALNVRYVLLAREVDWRAYQYLDYQPGLVKLHDFGSIVVFENRT